ncbi:hypothetical protein Desti_3231 [Desulfomonile tiedjei DSM 6799]|uniref:Uncharacterized protein n=1 Tax=Desulfomonile tiedjei (strain ATCC 49306 / DSM 6799 / DCB-1) TaxID=706587 RepID=I4C8J9_DESTA|nr:hypothetical protein Desti_3231 [Desulfomonile tiedjei DSM 6799]
MLLMLYSDHETQGTAFDGVDLDAWAAKYKDRNGRPG